MFKERSQTKESVWFYLNKILEKWLLCVYYISLYSYCSNKDFSFQSIIYWKTANFLLDQTCLRKVWLFESWSCNKCNRRLHRNFRQRSTPMRRGVIFQSEVSNHQVEASDKFPLVRWFLKTTGGRQWKVRLYLWRVLLRESCPVSPIPHSQERRKGGGLPLHLRPSEWEFLQGYSRNYDGKVGE